MSKSTAKLAIRGSAELPSHGLLVAKHRASGSRFSDQSVLLVDYFALHIAHRAAALHDPCSPQELRPARFWANVTLLHYDHRKPGFLFLSLGIVLITKGFRPRGILAKTAEQRVLAQGSDRDQFFD